MLLNLSLSVQAAPPLEKLRGITVGLSLRNLYSEFIDLAESYFKVIPKLFQSYIRLSRKGLAQKRLV
jgi:hypothetical protein